LVHKVLLDLKAHRVMLDHRVLSVLKVLKVLRVIQVLLVLLVLRVAQQHSLRKAIC
jgi:hypothetical protein